MHPDPVFWADLAQSISDWQSPKKPIKIHIFGANYDSDLTIDVYNEIKNRNVCCELFLDKLFFNVIEMIRGMDFVATYESGFGQIADVLKVPCLEIFRNQGGTRNNKLFPYLGPISPEGFDNRFWPFF